MRLLFFDTETTSFTPGQICQLSYVIDDGRALAAKNMYFTVSFVQPGAQGVHGLSVQALKELSCGMEFAARADEVLSDFESSSLVAAHNFDFDRGFIKAEFLRLNKNIRLENYFCTMKFFTPICQLPMKGRRGGAFNYKYPSLKELARFLDISDSAISKCASRLFGTPPSEGYHNACFDAAATYLCYRKGVETGLIPEPSKAR